MSQEKSLLSVPEGVVLHHIAPHLSLQDLSRLVSAYQQHNFFRGSFEKAKQQTIHLILELVAFGKQEEAEKLLAKHPKVLLQTGTVEDYSGRIFENITAFQYSLWAYDREMWSMLLKYLPEDKAQEQLYDHAYGKKIYKTLHNSHFDFTPLIAALTNFVNLKNDLSDALYLHDKNYSVAIKMMDKHWKEEVGGAQRMVPANIANEYCTHVLSNFPSFKPGLIYGRKLKRTLSLRDKSYDEVNWFPLKKDEGVGVDFGVWGFCIAAPSSIFDIHQLKAELEAVTDLQNARKNDFEKLKKRLLGAELVQSLDSKSMENPSPSA